MAKPANDTVRAATVYAILFAISSVHLLNDAMQTVVVALFPIFVESLKLSYGQIGWIAFTLNMTSSVMQPVVGMLSDKWPKPWMLSGGLKPENAAEAVRTTGATALDVSSGVEDRPGHKDPELIRRFLDSVAGL